MSKTVKWTGKKITEPCIVTDMPITTYHGDCTDGPGISSSGLRKIDSRSPAHYWATSYLNPQREPEEQKDAFDFGRAAHVLLLGESGFKQQFAIRPDVWTDWKKREAQDWKREQIAAGKAVLTPENVEAIKGIAASLAREPLIKAGLLQGDVERSLFWKDKKTGVWLKARPDVLPSSDGVAVDLKTCTDASPEKIQSAVMDYGYGMQGAVIGKGMKEVLGVEMTAFVLVWVEKTPPYAVNISPVDIEWIDWSGRQVRRAIDTFARCLERNEWPAYKSEITTSMPQWLRNRLEEEVRGGLLPEEGIAA